MKKAAILFIAVFATLSSIAQNYMISGNVLSASTGRPLEGASVFAQNTTLGTVTDEDGNYKLYLPFGGYDIIVTYTGYSTESKRVSTGTDGNKSLVFAMNEKSNDLESVIIVASNLVRDGLAKYGDFFMNNFIGQTINSRNCKVLNPEVLKFYYYKRTDKLKVMADEPLQIENDALGYLLTYSLDSFVHEYAPKSTTYTGYPLFSELGTSDSIQQFQWEVARKEAYEGSTLHFMRSVYDRTLTPQGFEIRMILKMKEEEKAFTLKDQYTALHYKKNDSLQTVEIYPNIMEVGVIYKKEKPSAAYSMKYPEEPKSLQFSMVRFTPNIITTIEQNGYFYDQNDLNISGYWAWEKIAELLPYNYAYGQAKLLVPESQEADTEPLTPVQENKIEEKIEDKKVYGYIQKQGVESISIKDLLADNVILLSKTGLKVTSAMVYVYGGSFKNVLVQSLVNNKMLFLSSNTKFSDPQEPYKISISEIKYVDENGGVGLAEEFTITVY